MPPSRQIQNAGAHVPNERNPIIHSSRSYGDRILRKLELRFFGKSGTDPCVSSDLERRDSPRLPSLCLPRPFTAPRFYVSSCIPADVRLSTPETAYAVSPMHNGTTTNGLLPRLTVKSVLVEFVKYKSRDGDIRKISRAVCSL